MKISKSSHHKKIAGDFGEYLVLYWLSKYGFECVHVDYTGIDIIAKNPHSKELMGISVKSRTRIEGTESSSLSIRNTHFEKVKKACETFNCVPYFAFIIDGKDKIYCYVVSMEHLRKSYRSGKRVFSWKMGTAYLSRYAQDSEIMRVEFDYKTINW